jgi:hypothetical protein
VREDRRQWEGEREGSGSRRVCGQRDYGESGGSSIGISQEDSMVAIGIRDGNERWKGGG